LLNHETPVIVQPWAHPVRARLEAGEIVVAITITTPNLETAAYAATLGFHLLWVEMEHSPITLESLRAIVLASRGLPAAVFARVPVNEFWTAKRVLDQGVSGVIFPFTSSPELASQAVAACKYPPLGRRGSGAGLATSTWPEPGNYYDSSDRHSIVVAVVEDKAGLENIDAIAATAGVDIIFIGTSDLAFSLGARGDHEAPVVRSAIERIVAAATKHGKVLGRPAGTPQLVDAYAKQGFRFFQAGTELGMIAAGARELLEPLKIAGLPREKRALY
jgi:2-keto-3-deoxy-L-rhamnonate aldolase RhmA